MPVPTPIGPARTQGPYGPIQVVPPGMLGLLQIKYQGMGPSALADVVNPVLELREWYLNARQTDLQSFLPGMVPITATVPVGSIGIKNFQQLASGAAVPALQVPSTEWWYVANFTITPNAPVAIGTVLQFTTGFTTGPIASPIEQIYGLPVSNDADTSGGAGAGAGAPFPISVSTSFWLPPGARPVTILTNWQASAGSLVQFAPFMRFTRCPI